MFPATSRVGNSTICSSIVCGSELFVLDAGRGLLALGAAMRDDARFRQIRRVHVFVSHAHLDHWEGLKDVDWFWKPDNGLDVRIWGTREALQAIRRGFAHPSYVSLEVLARGTTAALRFQALKAWQSKAIGDWQLETFPLHHYSGIGREKRLLDTLGFRLTGPGGVRVAYVCDHEPIASTRAMERSILQGTHLAIIDAHFSSIVDHCFGHGSQEHAAGLARQHPDTLILASHLAPMLTDTELHAARRRYANGVANYKLAHETSNWRWNERLERFVPGPKTGAQAGKR
jgi:phosphoribosyl 1,2-cyclic phosphodiesterase